MPEFSWNRRCSLALKNPYLVTLSQAWWGYRKRRLGSPKMVCPWWQIVKNFLRKHKKTFSGHHHFPRARVVHTPGPVPNAGSDPRCQCHSRHPKKVRLDLRQSNKRENCSLCLYHHFQLKKGVSPPFLTSECAENMFFYFLSAFFTASKPYKHSKRCIFCAFYPCLYHWPSSFYFSLFFNIVSILGLFLALLTTQETFLRAFPFIC